MTKVFSESPTPSADDTAQALLAACLVDNDAAERVSEILTPEDFIEGAQWGDLWSGIFTAIQSLVRRGKRPSPILVHQEMKNLGVMPKDHSYTSQNLAQLMNFHRPGALLDDYVNILREYGYRRRLRTGGHKWVDIATNDGMTFEERVAEAESVARNVTERTTSDYRPRKLGDVIKEQLAIHKARKKGDIKGIKTGFDDVDDILLGLQNGDYIIVAARPSMGKTAFAQALATNAAKPELQGGKKHVGIVSIEMPDAQLADRAIAAEGRVDGGLVRAGLVEARHWESVEKNLESSGLLEADVWIDDQSQTVPQIRAQFLRMKRESGLDLGVIDYLQIVRPSERYRGNTVKEVSEISAGIKALAKELGIPIIALSQLSRNVESREDKRPMLSDLRDSGAIEQDADVVVFLYRDEYYNPETTKKGIVEVNVAKHRNGALGSAELEFIGSRTAFLNIRK